MTTLYYVTYSAQTDNGSCVGRTSVARNEKIETFEDIIGVETAVLEVCREKEPSMRSLFLTYWAELRS